MRLVTATLALLSCGAVNAADKVLYVAVRGDCVMCKPNEHYILATGDERFVLIDVDGQRDKAVRIFGADPQPLTYILQANGTTVNKWRGPTNPAGLQEMYADCPNCINGQCDRSCPNCNCGTQAVQVAAPIVIREQPLYYNGSYSAYWSWQGDLREHMRREHGLETAGMSDIQVVQLHSSTHERTRSRPQSQRRGIFGGFFRR